MSVRTTTPLLPPAPTRPPAPGRALALVAVGAATVAALAIAGAGFLDPGYSQLSEGISALASRESGAAPVMTIGFVAMAVTLLAAGAALLRVLPGRRPTVGAVLLLLAGLLTLASGIFRQDCSSLQQACLARESAGTVSGEHWVHNLLALPLFLFLAVAAFFWGAALRRLGAARTARVSLVVAVLVAGLTVWFGSDAYGDLGGLVQRVLVLLAFGWPVYLAARFTRPASPLAA